VTTGSQHPLNHTFHVYTDETVGESEQNKILREMDLSLNKILDKHLPKTTGFDVESTSAKSDQEIRADEREKVLSELSEWLARYRVEQLIESRSNPARYHCDRFQEEIVRRQPPRGNP